MNKFYSLLILLLITVSAAAQVREWNGGNGAWNDPSKWTPSGIPATTDIVVFNGTSAIISNVPAISLQGLQLADCDIVLNATSNQARTISLGENNPGTSLVIGTGASLAISSNLHVELLENAKASIAGVMIVNAGSKFQTSATGTHTLVTGLLRNNNGDILSVASGLEFGHGSVYEHAGDKGKIPSATWHKSSTCHMKGVVAAIPGGLNQEFGNYKWDCVLQSAGASAGIAIPAAIKGDLVIENTGNNGDASVYVQLPKQLKISGAFYLNAGNCIAKDNNTTIDLAGDLVIRGGALRSASSQANEKIRLNFTGTERQQFSKTAGSLQQLEFVIATAASLDLGESVVDGEADFTLEPGAQLATAHPEGIAESGNTGAIRVKGKRVFSPGADYAFTGTTAQVTGSGLPSQVRRLIIANESGVLAAAGVKLTKATTVTKELVMTNGFLQTSESSMLTIADGGVASVLNNSFVTGPMQKTGREPFTFPTGWSGPGGGRIPIGISSLGASATIQAEYKRAPATEKGATIKAPLQHINYCEYWELFPVSGNPTAVITMYNNAHSNCNPVSQINDFSSVRVARSSGRAWAQFGNADDTANVSNSFVTSGVAGISMNKEERYFALANVTRAKDPMPVMFDNVAAYELNEGVNIEWSNLTERDIAIYYVERSENGKDYTLIGNYLPKSNRDDKAHYIFHDPQPLSGINFYRVKVIEKSTKIIFSKIMRVERGMPGPKLSLYPNPVTNRQFIVGMTGLSEGTYEIRIYSMTGCELGRQRVVNKGNHLAQSISVPATLRPGLYSLLITGNEYRETKMFIVQ